MFWITMENFVLFPFKLTTGLNIINEAANAKLNRSVNFKRKFWCRQIYQKKTRNFCKGQKNEGCILH